MILLGDRSNAGGGRVDLAGVVARVHPSNLPNYHWQGQSWAISSFALQQTSASLKPVGGERGCFGPQERRAKTIFNVHHNQCGIKNKNGEQANIGTTG